MISGGLRLKGKTKASTPDSPLITVITVVYNGAATLEQTIQSVVNQTYNGVEYIIIDGGSSDGTLDIIKKYEDKIDYWQSEPDKGVYDAMNKGILLANGEYIYILGCDDWLINQSIFFDISQYFNQGYDIISGKVWIVYKNGKQKIFENNYTLSKEQDIQNCTISAPHQGLFVKSDVMKDNLFDTNYKIASDFKSLLSLWLNNNIKILKISNEIAYYSNEGMSGKNEKLRIQETYSILKEFCLEKSNWAHKFGMDKKFFNILKRLSSRIGINYIFHLIIDCLNHKYIKHHCSWMICRYCHK